MAVRQTSILSYHTINLKKQRNRVLRWFTECPETTNRECASALGMEAGTVSARRNELVDEKTLEECGKRKCSITGKLALIWRKKSWK